MKRYNEMKENAVAEDEINIYNISSLMSATNLTKENIEEYIDKIR
jgi:hypothetical protein